MELGTNKCLTNHLRESVRVHRIAQQRCPARSNFIFARAQSYGDHKTALARIMKYAVVSHITRIPRKLLKQIRFVTNWSGLQPGCIAVTELRFLTARTISSRSKGLAIKVSKPQLTVDLDTRG